MATSIIPSSVEVHDLIEDQIGRPTKSPRALAICCFPFLVLSPLCVCRAVFLFIGSVCPHAWCGLQTLVSERLCARFYLSFYLTASVSLSFCGAVCVCVS